jgi:hypothetical protein
MLFTCAFTFVNINGYYFAYKIADTVNALSNGRLEKLLGKSQSQ